jgi:hypothetical protein
MKAFAIAKPRLGNPDDLLGQLQSTLAALADVELRYDVARESFDAAADPDARQRDCIELELSRDQERAPLLKRIDELQRMLMR